MTGFLDSQAMMQEYGDEVYIGEAVQMQGPPQGNAPMMQGAP